MNQLIPVTSILGNRTLMVLRSPDIVESYIVHGRSRSRFNDCTVLATGPNLNKEQIRLVQNLVFDPKSYHTGNPRYRRLPHKPEFALVWKQGNEVLEIMIDLKNPGWDFFCGEEAYGQWNMVGDKMVRLAKTLFPKFASRDKKHVWKRGMIKRLISKAG